MNASGPLPVGSLLLAALVDFATDSASLILFVVLAGAAALGITALISNAIEVAMWGIFTAIVAIALFHLFDFVTVESALALLTDLIDLFL